MAGILSCPRRSMHPHWLYIYWCLYPSDVGRTSLQDDIISTCHISQGFSEHSSNVIVRAGPNEGKKTKQKNEKKQQVEFYREKKRRKNETKRRSRVEVVRGAMIQNGSGHDQTESKSKIENRNDNKIGADWSLVQTCSPSFFRFRENERFTTQCRNQKVDGWKSKRKSKARTATIQRVLLISAATSKYQDRRTQHS